MGEFTRLDGAAMDAVADYLESAASDILLVGLNWPEAEHLSLGFELHVESARLWVDSVIERMDVWTKRARQIADALDRAGARRLQ